MTRALFWVLLAANIGLFWAMHEGSTLLQDEAVVQPPLNAEKIRLLDPKKMLFATNDTKSAEAKELTTCLEWGEFSDEELKQVMDKLSGLSLQNKLSKREVEYQIGYWVYIPPLTDKAATNEKISQLKERDVTEYFIVQEPGIWQNAISLGVFKTQEAAQDFLTTLRSKGVRSAQVGERGSKLKINVLRFDEVDSTTEAKLNELQSGFVTQELKSVQCGLTR
ncbi:MAG: SPOR domain-containing protein [Gallionella sp.]|nr:SPOR domain-containing protein [Gallionella sp.]